MNVQKLDYQLLNGKFGIYIRFSEVNYSIPRDLKINKENITDDIVWKIIKIKNLKNEVNNILEELKNEVK